MTQLFNAHHDYTTELKLRTISIAGTILATAITIGAVVSDNEYTKTLLTGSALGIVGVSRLAEGTRKRQDLINQDVSDISDAVRQQALYEQLNSGIASSDSSAVLELLPPTEGLDDISSSITSVPTYNLNDISNETHVAIIGESGSGKSYLAQHLIANAYSGSASVIALDTDASPTDWRGIKVVGAQVDIDAIASQMADDLDELKARGQAVGAGEDIGGEIVRIVEEFATLDAEIKDSQAKKSQQTISNKWLKQLLRRGRKYNMTAWLISQEFSVEALGISGEGGLRKAFTVVYLGKTAIAQLSRTEEYNELRQALTSQDRPCLVERGGEYYIAEIPNLENKLETNYTPQQLQDLHRASDDYVNDELESELQRQMREDDEIAAELLHDELEDDGDNSSPNYMPATSTSSSISMPVVSYGKHEMAQDLAKRTHTLIQGRLNMGDSKTKILKELYGFVGRAYSEKGIPMWLALQEEFGKFK